MEGPRKQPPNCRHPLATAGPAEDITAGPPESRPSELTRPEGTASSRGGRALRALLPVALPPHNWTGGCRRRWLGEVGRLSFFGGAG